MAKHIIWSNCNLNLDDWKDGILECHPNITDEYEMFQIMEQWNNDYLEDEKANLNNVVFGNGIIAIGIVGRWNGHFSGYKEIKSGKVVDCLCDECDYCEWYVEDGDFKFIGHHHDGTNTCTYRAWKDEMDFFDRDEFMGLILDGKCTDDDIEKYTMPIGNAIAEVYGMEVE